MRAQREMVIAPLEATGLNQRRDTHAQGKDEQAVWASGHTEQSREIDAEGTEWAVPRADHCMDNGKGELQRNAGTRAERRAPKQKEARLRAHGAGKRGRAERAAELRRGCFAQGKDEGRARQ